MNDRMALRAFAATLALWMAATAVGWLAVPALSHTPETIWKNSGLIPPFEKPARTADSLLSGLWQRYDTLWYQRIAARGYEDISTPFYPLLPLAAAAFGLLGLPLDWAVLLASRLAAWLAVWGLLRLAAGDHDERTAWRAVLFWLCWPMSFILLAGYSEPFLVAAMAWSLVFARDRRWWPAALCALAACLSRSIGVALLPALYWIAWRERPLRWLPLAAASIGPLLFPAYLKLNGFALPSESYPIYWRTVASAPWTTLRAALETLGTDHAGFVIFNLAAIVLVSLFVFTSRIRAEYKILSGLMAIFLLTANTTPPLHSMMRYSFSIFPAFIALAVRARQSWAVLLTASTFAMVNLLLLFFFFDWAYIV
jgi:hypothetical protein